MTSQIELEAWGKPIRELLPTDQESPVILDKANVPAPPDEVVARGLVIQRSFHDYDNFRVDQPQMYASRETYGALGALLLSTLLHGRTTDIRVALPHQSSEVKLIVLDTSDLLPDFTFRYLRTRVDSLEYWLEEWDQHPWYEVDPPPPWALPSFSLTNEADMVISEEDRASRDVLRGFGSIQGWGRFAKLLMDIGQSTDSVLEYALECEAGFRGVAPRSCEIRMWLPGSDAWVPGLLQDGAA